MLGFQPVGRASSSGLSLFKESHSDQVFDTLPVLRHGE